MHANVLAIYYLNLTPIINYQQIHMLIELIFLQTQELTMCDTGINNCNAFFICFWTQIGMFKPLLAATLKIYLNEFDDIEGFGSMKNMFTGNDELRFQSLIFDGTVESTNLVIYNTESKEKVLDQNYRGPFLKHRFPSVSQPSRRICLQNLQ